MGICGVTDGSFWEEMLPDQGSAFFPGSPNIAAAGDTVEAQVYYVNSTTMGVYVKDVTTGVTYDPQETISTAYNGATAEAIAERPSIEHTPVNLENYGSWKVDWDYVTGGSTNLETTSGMWNFAKVTMYNGSDDLSYVSTAPTASQGANGSFVTTFNMSS